MEEKSLDQNTGMKGSVEESTLGETHLAIRVSLMPRDTNPNGTIFGGVILSYVDLAGGIEAHKHALQRFVTVAMKEVVFHQPVFVGDVVSFYARTVRVGRTSVSVKVEVFADRYRKEHEKVKVTEAELTYVCVDDNRRPIPIRG
ncbi:MAG: acyl-CoA thioesterase [Terriglobia bacterium]